MLVEFTKMIATLGRRRWVLWKRHGVQGCSHCELIVSRMKSRAVVNYIRNTTLLVVNVLFLSVHLHSLYTAAAWSSLDRSFPLA